MDQNWNDFSLLLVHLAGMEAMLTPVDEPLIRALNFDAPCRIVDIGCGGGGTTFGDLAPGAGWKCRSRLRSLYFPDRVGSQTHIRSDERAIGFEIAGMATATASEEPYDRLASRFSITFFDDPLAALANLVRWFAPRGRFAFAVWRRPAENPWITNVRQLVAEMIDLPSPDSVAPKRFRYAEADKSLTPLDRAGYGVLDVDDWRGVPRIGGGPSAVEVAHFGLASFSSFNELLARSSINKTVLSGRTRAFTLISAAVACPATDGKHALRTADLIPVYTKWGCRGVCGSSLADRSPARIGAVDRYLNLRRPNVKRETLQTAGYFDGSPAPGGHTRAWGRHSACPALCHRGLLG